MKSKFNVKQLTLLAMLVAVLLLMAFTPLGYLNIGLLANHVQRHSRRHRRDRARTCRWSHRRIRFRADQLSAVHRHRRPESARLDAVQHQPVFHDRAVLCPPHAGRLPARLYFPHRRPL